MRTRMLCANIFFQFSLDAGVRYWCKVSFRPLIYLQRCRTCVRREGRLIQLSSEHAARSLRIGYESLPDDMKGAYKRLRSAVLSREKELTINDPDGRVYEHASKIFFAVRQDDPYLFYLGKTLVCEETVGGVVFTPAYLFNLFKERCILKKIEHVTDEMLKGLPDDTFDREIEIHKRVTESITFPADYNDGVRREEYQTLVGAFLNREAVCSGTANAMNLLLNRAGIRCGTIRGNNSKGAGHAWNIVELEGKLYHLDASIDTKDNVLLFEMFNVTDEACRSAGYSWECGFECNEQTMEYYSYTKSHVCTADIMEFVAERLSNGEREIFFKISDPENWNRNKHADVITSYLSKTIAPATVVLLMDEEKGTAKLTIRRL